MNDHYMYVARWEQERKCRGARAQEAARVLRVDGTITKEEVLVVSDQARGTRAWLTTKTDLQGDGSYSNM